MLKLALKNIQQKKGRSLLLLIAVAIGTASLLLFMSLSNGIKTATFEELEKSNPLTQITVRPNVENRGLLSILSQSKEGMITEESIQEISKIKGIKNIYPEIQFEHFASIEAKVLGLELITDSMVFGVEKEFIQESLENPKIWEAPKEPYPTIIPTKLLELYNFTIAAPQGLPTLSEELLLGKELILYPNYSTFFPGMSSLKDKVKLEVVGFSEKTNLIGVTLPLETVKILNEKYIETPSSNYIEIFVETDSENITPQIAQEIEDLGFSTQYYQKNIQNVEAKLRYLSISLGIISGIILLVTTIAIMGMFLSTAIERKKEIGLFRALGARKSHIRNIILTEAGLIGLLGSIVGVIIGSITSFLINQFSLKNLAESTFLPESFFLITPNLIIFTIIFGTLLSLISAYLPAHKASNINPIEALKH